MEIERLKVAKMMHHEEQTAESTTGNINLTTAATKAGISKFKREREPGSARGGRESPLIEDPPKGHRRNKTLANESFQQDFSNK